MAAVQQSILVEAPASTAFDFWSDFERFPTFMQGLDAVTPVGDGQHRWRRRTDSGVVQWETSLTECEPHRLIAWSHAGGRERSTRITFAPLEGNSCWMVLTLEVETGDMDGDVATDLGRISRRVEREMRTARDMIERQYADSKVRPGSNSGAKPNR